jgi:glutathione S-transferase
MDRLTLYGSFTSSSSYKPMLYLALARLPFSFRTVNLKTGVQKTPNTWRSTAGGSCHRCATAA